MVSTTSRKRWTRTTPLASEASMQTFTPRSRGGSLTVHDTATLQGFMAANSFLTLLAMHFQFLSKRVFSCGVRDLNP